LRQRRGSFGRLNEAWAEAMIAVAYHPTNVHAAGHLAHIEARQAEFDQADQTLQRALDAEPWNANLLGKLASLRTCREQAIAI
jgi:hypothetical protein